MSPRSRPLMGLIVLTIIQGIWALGLIIMLGVEIHRENNNYRQDDTTPMMSTTTVMPGNTSTTIKPGTTTTTTTPTPTGIPPIITTESPSNSTKETMIEEEMDTVRPYYIVCILISSVFMFMTVLFYMGVKTQAKALIKSYVDIDIVLTIITLALYILTLSDGKIVVDFAVVMGLFIVLRWVGIYLAVKYLDEIDVADIRNLPTVHHRNSNIIVNTSQSMTDTL